MADEVLKRIIELLSDVLNVPATEIASQSSPDTITNWDSMQHLNLMLALEEFFHLKFSPEEIEQMSNVEKINQTIKNKLS